MSGDDYDRELLETRLLATTTDLAKQPAPCEHLPFPGEPCSVCALAGDDRRRQLTAMDALTTPDHAAMRAKADAWDSVVAFVDDADTETRDVANHISDLRAQLRGS